MRLARALCAFVAATLLCANSGAAERRLGHADTLACRSDFKATQLVAPLTLMAGGVSVHCFAHDSWDVSIRDWMQKDVRGIGRPGWNGDDYLQYAPIVMNLGLGLVGVDAEHGLLDRAIMSGAAIASGIAISRTLKHTVNTLRPNGVDRLSFPSGHSVTSFMFAELVRMEYGWGWGAGAYAIATGVGVLRVYNNCHWTSDVLMGAGIGILSAHIGGWLLKPVKNILHIPTIDWGDGRPRKLECSVVPVTDPYSGQLCAAFRMTF